MSRHYKRVGLISLPTFLSLWRERTGRYMDLFGVRAKMGSLRYDVFANNASCVKCGITGTFMALEKSYGQKTDSFHFNLYAVLPSGQERLMTKDHIIPRSKGGSDGIENLQTMCTKCNGKKADKLEEKHVTAQTSNTGVL